MLMGILETPGQWEERRKEKGKKGKKKSRHCHVKIVEGGGTEGLTKQRPSSITAGRESWTKVGLLSAFASLENQNPDKPWGPLPRAH